MDNCLYEKYSEDYFQYLLDNDIQYEKVVTFIEWKPKQGENYNDT